MLLTVLSLGEARQRRGSFTEFKHPGRPKMYKRFAYSPPEMAILIWKEKKNQSTLKSTKANLSEILYTHDGGRKAAFFFPIKQHPSKLMGCNHHHKYSVTHPSARFRVFNSQSMGWKEWQARGTHFCILLTTSSKTLAENPPQKCAGFQTPTLLALDLGGSEEVKHLLNIQVAEGQYHRHCVLGTHQHCHLVK